MLKTTVTVIALGLIAIFLLPAEVLAGPFGLFKRCRVKPICCTSGPAGPSAAVIEARMSDEPRYATMYYCQAFFEGEDGEGEPCVIPGEMQIGTDCQAMSDAAVQSAYDAAEGTDCNESFVDVACSPACPERMVMTKGDCLYKATYKICCCDGFLINVPFYDASLRIAKFKAKTFACNVAASRCGARTRWAQLEICRVPGIAQVPCCK